MSLNTRAMKQQALNREVQKAWDIHPCQHTTITSAALRQLLLTTPADCRMFEGVAYEIKKKSLGAGVYKVWWEKVK